MLNDRMLLAMKKWREVVPQHAHETSPASSDPTRAQHSPRIEFLENYAKLVSKTANVHHAEEKVISRAEWQQCLQDLEKAQERETLDDRMVAIDRVAQLLNSKAVTHWSVKSMFPRARFLAIQKGFFVSRSNHIHGLADMLERAEKTLDGGQRDKAFAMLRQITAYIQGFKD
jgi:hypothetical protein